MTDIAVLATSIKTTLLEVAKQASTLGIGLQNAAPGEKRGVPNYSVQYLLEVSQALKQGAAQCDEFISASSDTPPRR